MLTKKRAQPSSPSQQQIADRLGVSRALVTHALNDTRNSRISDATRTQIRSAARQMNYRPRSLTTRNIGYLLPSEGDYLETEHTFVIEVERAARRAGYRLLIVGIEDESELDSLSDAFNAKTVDGMISPRWFGGRFLRGLSPEVPALLVADDDGIGANLDAVSTDACATVQLMAQHLVDRGHRKIGIAMNPSDAVKQHRDIVRGARQCLQINDIDAKNLTLARAELNAIPDVLDAIIQRSDAPTAWIVPSPFYTTALFICLQRHGRRIPEDVSLMSLIDSPQFRALPIRLTTTSGFATQNAELAVARLIEKIEQPSQAARSIRLTAEIIERDSVGAVQRRSSKKTRQ